MVLQLVSVLLHGREAKLIADRAADVISGVQNLREAVYEDYSENVAILLATSSKSTACPMDPSVRQRCA
jgi:hypothetical protein